MNATKIRAIVFASLFFWGVAFIPLASAVSDDYTFGSETVTKGYTTDTANRNAEDGSYESVIEADQYGDDNFSGTTESVTIGTATTGTFPNSLDSNDDDFRTYQEASTAPSNTVKCIRPSADTQKQWDGQTPGTSTTHYDLLDDTTAGGDGLVTSVNTNTTSDKDIYAMTDPSFSGSPSYDIRAWVIACKVGGTQSMNLNFGIRIGSTDYSAYSGNLNRDTFTNYSKGWTTDPSDSGEWTLTDLQGLSTYITTSDAAPTPYVTQIGIQIWANYSATYELDISIEWTSVTSTSQTTGYMVYCRGNVQTGSEYYNIFAWNYTSGAWQTTESATISAGSETDYSFSLITDERDATNNKVKLRVVDDAGGTGDTEQGSVRFDLLRVNRIEIGYAVEVVLEASGLPNYGDLYLRVKGYTTGEYLNLKMWNYTASSWSSTVIQVTAGTNTWYSYNFTESDFVSASTAKFQITDNDGDTSDTTRTTFFMDIAIITHYLQDPYFTAIEDYPDPCAQFQTVRFNATVWDADNQLPSSGYPKVNISGDLYTMTEVSGADLDTYNGKLYYYEISTLSVGVHYWNITTKDADSGEIVSATYDITIEASSHLTHIWDGEAGDELASTAENWNSDLVPEDYDSVTWDTTGTGNCRWDIVGLVVNFWNMTSTYDGELMIAEDVQIVYDLTQSATSCYLYGGSATISVGYNWTSWFFYGNSSTVELTGTGTISMRNNAANRFYNLAVAYTGQTTTLSVTYLYVSRNLDLNGGTLDLGAGYLLIQDTTTYSEFFITGVGTIDPTTGAIGASVLMTHAGNRYKNFSSSVTVPGLRWTNNQVGTATFTLVGDTFFSGNVWAVDAAFKHYIFDTNGYDMTVENLLWDTTFYYSSFTLDLDASTIFVTGTFSMDEGVTLNGDESNFVLETDSYYLAHGDALDASYCIQDTANDITVNGTGVVVDMALNTGNDLLLAENLIINPGCDAKLGSFYDIYQANFTITGQLVNDGELEIWSKLNITGDSTTPMQGFGRFNGTIYLNGTAASHFIESGLPTGDLYINRTTSLNTSAGDRFIVSPSTEDYHKIAVLDFVNTSYGYLIRWNQTASAALDFNITAGPSLYYKRLVNLVNDANLTADPSGWLNFTFAKNLSEAISITLVDENLTIALGGEVADGGLVVTLETIGIIVTLVIGFGCLAFGLFRREYFMVSGLTWIVGGIFFFTDLHLAFTIISLGLGIILLLTTAVDYLEPKSVDERTRH